MMSEGRRAPLITFTNRKGDDQQPKKTVRISVVLPESNEDTCPEYNYKDELAAAKKLVKYKEAGITSNGLLNGDDFDDEDEVRKIARRMEEKYGTGISLNKKKRKGRKDDYADIGMGYDESDSFIDNTDGYDEIIPQNVTTLHGGFYINSGALEFKTDDEASSDLSSSSSDDDVDEDKEKRSGKKRIIESSDETDRENKTDVNLNQPEKKRKMQPTSNGNNTTNNGITALPLKKTVKELLKEKRVDLNMTIPDELLDYREKLEDKDNKKDTTSVADIIESVVKASSTLDTSKSNSEKKEMEESIKVTDSQNTVSSDKESSHDMKKEKFELVKLPENLPTDIVDIIELIKQTASKNTEGKMKFFTTEVNTMFLKLERKCKCLGKSSKLKVYEHLSYFVKCRKETLIKRAKHLVFDEDQKKLKLLITNLKSEIDKLMPNLLENYEKESKKILEKKFSQESADNEEMKSLRMPKRRFQWTETIKKFLKDILAMKKRCLLMEGKQREELETHINIFLKNEIQILWPEGWMSMNALNKVYTTFLDPKRVSGSSSNSNNTSPNNQHQQQQQQLNQTAITNISQNSQLSITPIMPTSKPETKNSTPSMETTIDLTVKSVPVDMTQNNENRRSVSPKKELDKQKMKLQNDVLKTVNTATTTTKKLPPSDTINRLNNDNVIILDGLSPKENRVNNDKMNVKEKTYQQNQAMNLSEKEMKKTVNDLKMKTKLFERSEAYRKDASVSLQNKHLDLSITPNYTTSKFEHKSKSSAGDDIQKVMEDLKVLQKMSSPKKNVIDSNAGASSAVSVIAVNKTFAPKTTHNSGSGCSSSSSAATSGGGGASGGSSVLQRMDYSTSYQDEFQKQLFGALNQMPTSQTKSSTYNRYPHISSSSSTVVSSDKYLQNSSGYTQNINGHKNTIPSTQPGTYSILDDVFANLLTQFGYPKEASMPKPQQK